jgi:hypothetical protein
MPATEIDTTSVGNIDRAFADLLRSSFTDLTEGFVVCRRCHYLSSAVVDGRLVDIDAPVYTEDGKIRHKCGGVMRFLKDRG